MIVDATTLQYRPNDIEVKIDRAPYGLQRLEKLIPHCQL